MSSTAKGIRTISSPSNSEWIGCGFLVALMSAESTKAGGLPLKKAGMRLQSGRMSSESGCCVKKLIARHLRLLLRRKLENGRRNYGRNYRTSLLELGT